MDTNGEVTVNEAVGQWGNEAMSQWGNNSPIHCLIASLAHCPINHDGY
jgi:hypothetical protein